MSVGNQSTVLLASAARTATQTTPDITNLQARGVHVVVDVTNAGTGAITPKIQGKAANGVYYDILVGAAQNSNGTVVLKVYPGATVTANLSASDVLPAVWRIVSTHTDANSITYSVAINTLV